VEGSGVLKHFLFPGTLFADPKPHQVSTVLGSCVAVCLWDSKLGISGINHYMLPLWNGEGLATPKYGNIAIEKLFDRMQVIGCKHDRLVAKIFGGANVTGAGNSGYLIGDRNITLAKQILSELGIPIVACDVGGRVGRKIILNTDSGVVFVGKGRVNALGE
jgi:chemotaxis protein CheD